ncbi:MAG: BlaI/MecI/CopY family transcriptional regulator [bacterium]|nr:BlaI/MecI/CopY family transcriptional regulator [bacterium]
MALRRPLRRAARFFSTSAGALGSLVLKKLAGGPSVPRNHEQPLSRREREILDIVYARDRATAAEIQDALREAPSYSAVRALVRILEEKGHLRHEREGVRNVYEPTRNHAKAGRSAMKRALDTFFGGDVGEAMSALLDASDTRLSRGETKRLEELIRKARGEGR